MAHRIALVVALAAFVAGPSADAAVAPPSGVAVAEAAPLRVVPPSAPGASLAFTWDLRDARCARGVETEPCRLAVVGTLVPSCPAWQAVGDLYRFDDAGFATDTGFDVSLVGDGGSATVTVTAGAPDGLVVGDDLAACPATPGQSLPLTGVFALPA